MSLKRILVTLGLVTVATLALVTYQATKLRAADQRNFWFLNNTGRQIEQVYVSPHESGYWGSEVLGVAALPDGTGTVIVFSRNYRTSCVFDFKLVFDDRTVQIYTEGRNICSLHAVEFDSYTSQGF